MGLPQRIRSKLASDGLLAVLRAMGPFARERVVAHTRELYYRVRETHEVRIHGLRVDTDAAVLDDEMRRALRRGRYERDEVDLITHFVTGEYDVIELGAGIGVVSGVIESRLPPDRTFVVVEADDAKLPLLRSLRKKNNLQFHIEHAAYSGDSNDVTLHRARHPTSSSVFQRDDNSNAVDVRGTDLATIRTKYGIDEFTLVADIEGAEFEMLDAELDLLEAACRLLIVEFHRFTNASIADYERRLLDRGFERVASIGDVRVFEP